jgi:hypothetical protein
MVDLTDLELAEDDMLGVGLWRAPDDSAETLRKRAIVALAGNLLEGTPNWPPRWPLSLAPTSSDEKSVCEYVRELGLDERGYHDLLRDAYALLTSKRFDRMARVTDHLLQERHHLDQRTLKAIKAAADDNADRDELGVISDAQVEKDIEQLRRQQAEEAEVVLASPNGDGPAKGVAEDWGESVFRSLRSVMARAEQERELRDLRRRCDEVAHEVAFGDPHNASGET